MRERQTQLLARAIQRSEITGLVLAGGQGRRMGGLEKGLQGFQGRPLVAHALARLAPQVGPLLISANRHLAEYAQFGTTVLPDASDAFQGPLAGLLQGLRAARTPWLLCVPCDVPQLPADLGARLADALLHQGGSVAIAVDAQGRSQPLFALIHTELRDTLEAALARGERRVEAWMHSHGARGVRFGVSEAFRNLNTRAELTWPGLELRAMTEADLPAYKALRDTMLHAFPSAFVSDEAIERQRSAGSYATRLANGAQGACLFSLVALHEGEMLGAVTVEREQRGKKQHLAHLVGMMVAPSAQGRGLGRGLLDATLARLRSVPGIEMVTLSVTSSNAAAIHLYRQCGFVTYGRLQRAIRLSEQRYDDQDLMQLVL